MNSQARATNDIEALAGLSTCTYTYLAEIWKIKSSTRSIQTN